MRLTIDLSEGRVCAKCGTPRTPLFRHHKGNDAMLGRFNKKISFNYDKYLDCCHLCLEHHCEIHYIYVQRLTKFWVDTSADGAWRMRLRCIRLCDKWLTGRVKTPKIPEEFKENFYQHYEESCQAKKEQQETGSQPISSTPTSPSPQTSTTSG